MTIIIGVAGKDTWDKAYILFTGGLVIIGLCTFLAVWYQARKTAESAKATSDSVRAIKEQAAIMERQTKAAEIAAAAARDSVEIQIAKERALIKVTMLPLIIGVHIQGGIVINAVWFEVSIFGSTPAYGVVSGVFSEITDSFEPPPPSTLMMPTNLPHVIEPPKTYPFKCSSFLYDVKTQEDIDSIRERRKFVHIQGFIKYTDFFDRERKTAFRYRWNVTSLRNFDGTQFAYWDKCGSPEDNEET